MSESIQKPEFVKKNEPKPEYDYIFPNGICTECKHSRELHYEDDEPFDDCSVDGCNCGNNVGR